MYSLLPRAEGLACCNYKRPDSDNLKGHQRLARNALSAAHLSGGLDGRTGDLCPLCSLGLPPIVETPFCIRKTIYMNSATGCVNDAVFVAGGTRADLSDNPTV